MRNKFDEQLEELHNELLQMGTLLEQGINFSNSALLEQNTSFAKKTIDIEYAVDKKEKIIEELCLKLLLHQQPVAKDLRIISSALKMITDMERIGDQIADISEIVLKMIGSISIIKLEHLNQMAIATSKMISSAINAFIKNDVETVKNVIKMDDVVDSLFYELRKDLVDLLREDIDCGNQVLDFLMIAKYYERIGDHCVNIAEWILFSLTGKHKDFN